jgi:hypothetical protein
MMKILKSMLLCCCVLMSAGISSKAKEWRRIVPLHSTRAEVERQLGSASNECKCSYYLEDVNVFIVYSVGYCKSGEPRGWNVPMDTVISIQVTPKVRPKLSALKIDEKEYVRTEDPELPGIFYYTNDAEGLTIVVDQCVVTGFYYEGTAKDKQLQCPSHKGSALMKRSRDIRLVAWRAALRDFQESRVGSNGTFRGYGADTGYTGTNPAGPFEYANSNPGNDQTHHFVTYFSGALNGQTRVLGIHRRFVETSDADKRLGDKAVQLGTKVRKDPGTYLKGIGTHILTNVCDYRDRYGKWNG